MINSKITTNIYRWRVRSGLFALILTVLLAQPTPLLLLSALAVTSAGLSLRLWACGHLKKEQELTTSGPYRYTRNPLYLGNLLIGIAVVIASNSWWVVFVFVFYFLVFYPVIILEEKKRMEKLFPQQYSAYSSDVPLFFPKVRSSLPRSDRTFSWQLCTYNKENRALFGALIYWLMLTAKMFIF